MLKFFNQYKKLCKDRQASAAPEKLSLKQAITILDSLPPISQVFKRVDPILQHSDIIMLYQIVSENESAKSLAEIIPQIFKLFLSSLRQEIKNAPFKIFLTANARAMLDKVDIAPELNLSTIEQFFPKQALIGLEGENEVLLIRRESRATEDVAHPVLSRCLYEIPVDNINHYRFHVLFLEDTKTSFKELEDKTTESLHQLEQMGLLKDEQELKALANLEKVKLVLKIFLYMASTNQKEKNWSPRATALRKNGISEQIIAKKTGSDEKFMVHYLNPGRAMTSKNNGGNRTTKVKGHWVRGHFRSQACGAGRKEHKIIFIAPFFKGDAENLANSILCI